MKRYIVPFCLLTSFFSFTADSAKHHTWFILNECINKSSFETESAIKFVNLLSTMVVEREKMAIILSSGEFIHKNKPPSKLISLTSKGVVIFCCINCKEKEAQIDIYTDKADFDRNNVGAFCRENFEARGYGMAYTETQINTKDTVDFKAPKK